MNRERGAGASMGLARGVHCCVWGGLAALLYSSAANPGRDLKPTLTPPEARFALAHAEFAVAGLDAKALLDRFNARAARPDPDVSAAPSNPPADPTADPTADPDATVSALDAVDECVAAADCIDQYLWSLYERARKVDTVKVQEKIKVAVKKKKGKIRTVTKTVTKLVDEDFTWKDPQAAEKAGMSVAEYVIGGMDRDFRVKLYHLMRAMDQAGLAPGITSGFRDNYRQSIASGLKAATDSSYHGGSRRGGYGHGLAVDVVSVKGETRAARWVTSEALWKWIDANGQQFGI